MSGITAIKSTDHFAERGFLSNQAAAIPELNTESASEGSRILAILTRLLAPLAGRLDPLTPLILTTTVGQVEYVERAVLSDNPQLLDAADPDRLAHLVKLLLGLRGPAMVVSSACASSAVAISRAAAMVRHGQAPQVLVVACDSISELVFSGFSGLLGMSDQPARPFDANRDGLSLGEAGAWALVADADSPAATTWAAEILGWGSSTDAVHMTAPDRAGRGLCRAITKACDMAGRAPEQIQFIAAHGTATSFSDAMEMAAFLRIFHQPRPVFSTKGGTGHTLAAAGLLQLLIVQKALSVGTIPPTVGLANADVTAIGWVSNKPTHTDVGGLAISTNSGFGGANTALLLGGRVPS